MRPRRTQGLRDLPLDRERPGSNRRASEVPALAGSPSEVLRSLGAIRGLPGHRFWPDDISIADPEFFVPELLSSHSRVTDGYLLALARAKRGRLATMDQKLAAEVVPGGSKMLELIPTG